MALWFPSGNTNASNLGSPGFDTTTRLYLTAWIYTGPSQTAKILSIWPGNENGSFLLDMIPSGLNFRGHAASDFETYYAQAPCYLKDVFAYLSAQVNQWPDPGDTMPYNEWMFVYACVKVAYRSGIADFVRLGAWNDDEGPKGSSINVLVQCHQPSGEAWGGAGWVNHTGELINPDYRPDGACDYINLEAFDMWKVYEPVTNFSIGGVGASSLFEGAICEVALWDESPNLYVSGIDSGPLGYPRSFMPLVDTTNLLAYWPMINSLVPAYVDTTKNTFNDLVGATAGTAYFGAHPFPIEQSPWYGDLGQIVEKAVPIYVEPIISMITDGDIRRIRYPDRKSVVCTTGKNQVSGPERLSAVRTSSGGCVKGPSKKLVVHTGKAKKVRGPDKQSVVYTSGVRQIKDPEKLSVVHTDKDRKVLPPNRRSAR